MRLPGCADHIADVGKMVRVGGTGKSGRGLLESLAWKNNNTMEDFDHDYQQTSVRAGSEGSV